MCERIDAVRIELNAFLQEVTSWAFVTESPLANNVTSWPSASRPSVSQIPKQLSPPLRDTGGNTLMKWRNLRNPHPLGSFGYG